MRLLEPVVDQPAAVASIDGDRTVLIADYHAGIEAALRYERGVQIPSHAPDRRDRLCALLDRTDANRLVILGDLMHSIGDPGGAERGELEVLFETMPPVDVTLVKGNHDGAIESWLTETIDRESATAGSEGARSLTVVPGDGTLLGGETTRFDGDDRSSHGDGSDQSCHGEGSDRSSHDADNLDHSRIDTDGGIGVFHGHSWPSPDVFRGTVCCMGHEHPCVRLEDDVGGSRIEPVWLRGRLNVPWLRDRAVYAGDEISSSSHEADEAPHLVVLPAFNELAGGTWINVSGQSFLSPLLPEGLIDGEAYLLDGTRLGAYDAI